MHAFSHWASGFKHVCVWRLKRVFVMGKETRGRRPRNASEKWREYGVKAYGARSGNTMMKEQAVQKHSLRSWHPHWKVGTSQQRLCTGLLKQARCGQWPFLITCLKNNKGWERHSSAGRGACVGAWRWEFDPLNPCKSCLPNSTRVLWHLHDSYMYTITPTL